MLTFLKIFLNIFSQNFSKFNERTSLASSSEVLITQKAKVKRQKAVFNSSYFVHQARQTNDCITVTKCQKLPQHFSKVFDSCRRVLRDVVEGIMHLDQPTTNHAAQTAHVHTCTL